MDAERRVLGARAPTKFSEEILQWVGTHKVLAENVSGYGNFKWFTYMNLYPIPLYNVYQNVNILVYVV